VDLKYILSILNSKAVGYYIASFGDKSKQTLFPRVSMKMLKQIPIPSATQEQQKSIVEIVNNILQTKEVNSSIDTTDMENKIDLLVYQLYDLTYDEVLIVDPETPITRKEYENRIK
jgi:restriction endonuclease S subunit